MFMHIRGLYKYQMKLQEAEATPYILRRNPRGSGRKRLLNLNCDICNVVFLPGMAKAHRANHLRTKEHKQRAE
jgi:hypothetical protein